MTPAAGSQSYIYRTEGVCPPEIHFRIECDLIREIRFVGGGCPGNARLVGRLLKDQPLEKILGLLEGIDCRNKTSCPDQLLRALTLVRNGKLLPSHSFRITADTRKRKRLALVGDLGGRVEVWEALAAEIKKTGIRTIYCLGNLTDPSRDPRGLLRALRNEKALLALQGESDWVLAGRDTGKLPEAEKEYLSHLSQAVSFYLGKRKGLGFFGQYLQNLPGYSDFEPYSLEMNMVVNLTRFMEDETVFPALEAMIPQFEAKVVVFSQRRQWGHWTLGDVDFISLGPGRQDDELAWGLLEEVGGKVHLGIERRLLKIGDKGSRSEDKD